MKSVGIICEYNPFHNGHLYHLNKVREMFPNYIIILVMSGHFMQRGETSIINKWDKTKIALEFGIDLIVELPFVYASQSADIFAKGAIQILNHLKVDKLVFGSESDDINNLISLVDIQMNHPEYFDIVKKALDEGINYPTALSNALYKITGNKVNTPNDILGLSYIKEIKRLNSHINPICIKRTNNYHSLTLDNDIVSASSIRHALGNNKQVKNFVPETTYKFLQNNLHFIDDYFSYLKYKILTEKDLSIYQTVDEGIENRIKKYIINSSNLEELIANIKTKRYTYNKLRRMFTHILCSFTKEEAKVVNDVEYIRVLGFNNNGKTYLNKIKKQIQVPIVTNYPKHNNKILDIDFRATCVYSLILNEKDKINLIEAEYKNKPIIR